ncbi:unnamed protein product [Bursaphelenchus okinawaensis]|uniref:Chromodomain-helicase-DNA-binding protein 1 n=1 Tax=Bursaphelenchus okinawaensis TaxID=465554 RepID=A0A811JU35_9BILA|nr:unnamed protein product [Bursaphelenchus okinawaensis]CAG9083289.1 unnamed protein product [Bursaphelenchus okinawaensis]
MASDEGETSQSSSSDSESEDKQSSESGNDQVEASPSQTTSDEEEVEEEEEESEDEEPKKKQNRRSKIDVATLNLLKEENLVRRSSRKRKIEEDSEEESPRPSRGKRKKKGSSSESGNSSSSSESEEDYEESPRKKRKPAKKVAKGKAPARRSKAKSVKVNYQEESSESEDYNTDEVLEWDEGRASVSPEENQSEVVERVLKHRYGLQNAIGSNTTDYNVQVQGDPNAKVDEVPFEERELQFLIKWQGWSHWHNTWESSKSLAASGAKGSKKIDNYIKKMQEIELWKRSADKEYIEVYDCEQEMNEELYEQYKIVERVIGHQVSRDKNADGERQYEYFVKWSCLSYGDCTWEDETLIRRQYSNKIDEYNRRTEANTVPHRSQHYRKRPKFEKLETMPDYLKQKKNPEMELRDYQLQGLNWLLHAWSKENSCILADEMGLGKTIQSISFVSSLFHLHQIYGPFLVVVPLSTMAAWQREFEAWASDVNVVTYVGDVTSREQIRQYELYQQGTKKLRVNVFLTTYEILLKDKAFLGTFDWQALLVDEAHRLKNDESLLYQCLKNFHTAHRVLITGTPLQNSLKELWALLHFIMPEQFSNWDEFDAAHQDRDHKGISSLHKKLEPFLIRRVKKDVEKSLPAKVEQILRVDMTAQQKQFYKWILTRNYEELSKGVKGSINGFVNVVMELKKCCNHSSLVRQYDNVEYEAQRRLQQLLKSSGKLILLDKLLVRLKETGHRVLIFSQMVMMLDILQEYMSLRRFATQRLDGSMRSDLRKQALDHFNAEGSNDFCFLLSTRAGGLGINLATADTVIIFDSDWNPQNDLQAMSRAHRIGQKKQVNIYRLVTKNSVEENIVERAKQKLVLDHLVIQRMDTTGKTVLSKSAVTNSKIPFDKNDLNAILKFGAEELFREKEGEEQELEVDIDDILSGAETRECDNVETGNELLNSFKYTNFILDEEKDLAMLNTEKRRLTQTGMTEAENKSWDDIIPKDKIEEIKNEELLQQEALLNLGPRQRNKVNGDDTTHISDDEKRKKKKKGRKSKNAVSDSDSSGSDSEGGGKRRNGKKKVLFNFTEKEIRRFMKSYKKFSFPMERLDSIAQDAELEDRSTTELLELAEEIKNRCTIATESYSVESKPEEEGGDGGRRKHDRGPTFKIGNLDVYVRPLLKAQQDLEPLHELVKKYGAALKGFTLPSKVKDQNGWDMVWTEEDDVALLKGIYKYGYGSWESIKMDPDLGLADKIQVKDKTKKPQPKHLQTRVDYVVRCINKMNGKAKRKAPKTPKTPKTTVKKTIVKKVKTKREEKTPGRRDDKKEKREDDHKDDKFRQSLGIRFNIEKYGSALSDKTAEPFQKVVEAFRPMIKYIKRLVSPETDFEHEGVKALVKVGDFIVDFIKNKKSSSWTTDRWFNLMWIFVSSFFNPAKDPKSLFDLYIKHGQSRDHKHTSKHNSSSAHNLNSSSVKSGSHRHDKHHSRHHHHHSSDTPGRRPGTISLHNKK